MKNKLNLSLFLILAIALSIIPVMAVGVVTINTPATNEVISGTSYMLNVSADAEAGNFSCEIYVSSTLTANSSWTLVATIVNGTEDPDYANATFSTSVVEDANNYIFNASCNNDTDDWSDVTNTGITIDNSVPTAPSSLTPSNTVTNGSFTFRGTVTDSETTSCTLRFEGINPGSSSYTMTYSGSDCSHALTNIPAQTYRWYIRASDESNTTDSSVQTTNIETRTSSGRAVLGDQARSGGQLVSFFTNESGGLNTTTIVIIGIVVLIVWFVIARRK